jgi:FixJ family two-component response regulator
VQHVTQHSNTPIAVLTAYGNMDIAIAALKAGAFDFVSKPVNQIHLDQLLQKALIDHKNRSSMMKIVWKTNCSLAFCTDSAITHHS